MDILPVSGWQVVREADDTLAVRLSGAPDGIVDEAAAKAVRCGLAEEGAIVPSVRVQRVAKSLRRLQAKHR